MIELELIMKGLGGDQPTSRPIATTGIFRYMRWKLSRRTGRGIMLGTVMKAGHLALRTVLDRVKMEMADCKVSV